MWKIIKAEFTYFKYVNIVLLASLPLYTVMAIIYKEGFHENDVINSDMWGGLFSMLLYFHLFFTWTIKSKYRYIVMYDSLPISKKELSMQRIIVVIFPFLLVIMYMVLVHLVILRLWIPETISVINQMSFLFLFTNAIVLSRNFRNMEVGKGKKFRDIIFALFFVVMIWGAFGIYYSLPFFAGLLSSLFGEYASIYAKGIFAVVGILLMYLSHVSYLKRKTYLVE